MKKAGILTKLSILVLILIVPGFLYYLLVAEGKNRYKPLPVFGPKSLAKTFHRVKGKNIPDTIYHVLPDFSLTSQDGLTVSPASFDKKIFVADFFYTGCPTVCKTMNNNVNQLVTTYSKNPMVYFVSITVDPTHDNARVLKQYAHRFNQPARWLFLTGDTAATYSLARNGFLVNALQTGSGDFIYSDKLILIDQQKRIRGYYTGASTADVSRLDDEIKVLIAEELRNGEKPVY